MESTLDIILYLCGKTITIFGIIFAILYIAKHSVLAEFFNKRAGMTIVPSRIIGKVEKRTFAIGAVVGVLQWIEAIAGDSFMKALNIIALLVGAFYLYKMYKRLQGTLEPAALKWALVYKGCTLCMFYVGGALLSIVAILLLVVLPMFLKGADYVWNDTFSYSNPSTDGGGIRTCRSCKYWDKGYCSFHNMEMPPYGGCGKND